MIAQDGAQAPGVGHGPIANEDTWPVKYLVSAKNCFHWKVETGEMSANFAETRFAPVSGSIKLLKT
jgi:hypothetical protein